VKTSRRELLVLSAVAAVAGLGCHRDSGTAGVQPLPRMAPSDLAAQLDRVRDGAIDVLHVGPAYLFGKARVPHSRHAGEASTGDGYAAIVAELRKLPPDRDVVLYCGCCPTTHCPNIGPAQRAAREVGLRRARLLDLPTNLRTDWIAHGYPVEKG